MKKHNFFMNIIFFAVISGGLCGYVLGVISGILPIFNKNMGFSNTQISLVAGAILLGCVISSIYTGVLNDWIGRKFTMSITFLFYAVGAAVFCFSNSFSLVYVSRFLQGVGFGMAVIVIPVYLSEISSKLNRGKVIASFQLALTGGVLLSNVFNLFLATNLNWRAVIIVIFIVSCFLLYYTILLPESPRWLFNHGGSEKAKKALECLNIKFKNKQTWDEISILANKEKISIFKVLTKRSNVIPILIVTAAVSLNQLSGINGFLQCSVTILKQTGISSEVVGLIGGISITGINFIATILTLIFIERLGRRKILKIGTFALLITLILLGILNYILPETPIKGYITLVGIVLVVGFFAFGPGGVILVLCAELLPNRVRGIGLSIAFTIGGLVGMFFVSAFLPLSSIIGYSGLFFLIAFFVFCYVLISFTIPETKGKTLEEIEQEYKK